MVKHVVFLVSLVCSFLHSAYGCEMVRTRNNLRANMDSGLLKEFRADESTCTSQCLDDVQCESVVFRKSGGDFCYMYKETGNLRDDSGHDYYEKDCGGNGGGEGCSSQDDFETIESTFLFVPQGYSQFQGKMMLSQCTSQCLQQIQCLGVNFNFIDNSCIHLYMNRQTGGNAMPNEAYTYLERICNGDGGGDCVVGNSFSPTYGKFLVVSPGESIDRGSNIPESVCQIICTSENDCLSINHGPRCVTNYQSTASVGAYLVDDDTYTYQERDCN